MNIKDNFRRKGKITIGNADEVKIKRRRKAELYFNSVFPCIDCKRIRSI